MKLDQEYSHRHGLEIIKDMGEYEGIAGLLNDPSVMIEHRCAVKVNEAIARNLSLQGWAAEPEVCPGYKLTINAMRNRVGLTVQTGNVARAFYDLMKFQAMHLNGRIDSAVLILPSAEAARLMGSNIANFDRVTGELLLFKHVITCPCMVISFE